MQQQVDHGITSKDYSASFKERFLLWPAYDCQDCILQLYPTHMSEQSRIQMKRLYEKRALTRLKF